MQFIRESSGANIIRAWELGRVLVGEKWVTGPMIVSADTIVSDWQPKDPRSISLADLEPAIALNPEIIVLGTGVEPETPDTDLMSALAEQSIGLEIMTTPAACRTYNVLVHEARRVAAALYVGPIESSS